MSDLRAKLKDERRKRIDAETKVSLLEEALQQSSETGQVDALISILEDRKRYWHDTARGLLIGDGPETEDDLEQEDANHMYGVYIDVVSDMRDFKRKRSK